MMKLSEKARIYASECHARVNHFYGKHPYAFHLEMVAETAKLFLTENYSEEEKELILAACWVHDVIEDARETYNDVKNALGEEVAEIAYALTNEKGRNRAERANDAYYEGIRNTPHAILVKLCDRIANITYSKETKAYLLEVYKKENDNFCKKLGSEEKYAAAYAHLYALVSE
jgi:(p)ppGpp synthase/HD superfamily hydrolase